MKAIVVYTKTFPRYSARCEDCTVSFPLENQEAGSKLYDPGSSRLEVLSKIKYLYRPDLFVSRHKPELVRICIDIFFPVRQGECSGEISFT